MAGIWRGAWFAASLLWTVKAGDDRVVHKLEECPSWSWASVPKPVQYCRLPIRKIRPSSGWWEDYEYLVEAASWDLDLGRPYGGVSGCVTVRCKLLKEADMDCERHVVEDFLNRPPKSRTGVEAIHYHVQDDDVAMRDVVDAWVIPVRTRKHVVGGALEAHIGTTPRRYFCVLLG